MKSYLSFSKTKLSIKSFTFLLTAILFYTACSKTIVDPPDPNDEELITTMRIDFTDSAGVHAPVTALFKDADGAGGNAPSQWDTITLKANTTYNAKILLLDETKSPADTISNEVLEEATEHLFCFNVTTANINVIRTDKDANNLEIGLESKWLTGFVSSGSIQILLRHQPDIKTGSCAPGASDIDVVFQVKVE